ncbi:MAG: glucose-methanol-choline oxidoreductase [Bradyrhizobium sp.]|nr:glucose-methanol-choline oxidoreductase [Bradyrhizobium sp.]
MGDADAQFDIVIIGAGTAGCVLASRLSEEPGLRVLLVEAGPDAKPGTEHPDIRDPFPISYGNPAFSWPGLTAEVSAPDGEGRRRSRHYLQGRGVGGSSNIQGMAALRGIPGDYDGWAAAGVSGWSWDELLPWFNRLEHDLDSGGALHGASGPVPIRRTPPEQWAPFAAAVGDALQRRGLAPIADLNGSFGDGVGPMPMANLPDRRASASIDYLTASVRARPNLTVLADALVERLRFEENRFSGIDVRCRAGRVRFTAREAIVACGAVYSPALLMRSGIGPGDVLGRAGIPVRRALAGVGLNLQNHPEISLVAHLRRNAVQDVRERSWGQNCARYSSQVADCPAHDMLLVTRNKGGWHALGRRMGGLGVAVYKPFSRGAVTVSGGDPDLSPAVTMNLLDDPRDLERLVAGLRLALEVIADPAVARFRNEVFLAAGKTVRRLNAHNLANRVQTWALAALFDVPALRHLAMGRTTLDVAALARDEEALRRFVIAEAGPTHHLAGTCRMGASSDPEAVLDSDCRVLGLDGLRVVDASIFPTLMRANTHLPVLMAAEKMADAVRSAWRAGRQFPAPVPATAAAHKG